MADFTVQTDPILYRDDYSETELPPGVFWEPEEISIHANSYAQLYRQRAWALFNERPRPQLPNWLEYSLEFERDLVPPVWFHTVFRL